MLPAVDGGSVALGRSWGTTGHYQRNKIMGYHHKPIRYAMAKNHREALAIVEGLPRSPIRAVTGKGCLLPCGRVVPFSDPEAEWLGLVEVPYLAGPFGAGLVLAGPDEAGRMVVYMD